MIYSSKSASVAQFTTKGFLEREAFSHRAVAIAKQYPDTFLLLERRGIPRTELMAGRFYQINLYSDHLSGLPPELFADRAVNWHNQQLGERGLIAAAGLYLQENSLIITVMQSDLCQQLYRHAELKRTCETQVDKRFGGWHRILFNAILDFAVECGAASVSCPTAASIVGYTLQPVRPDLCRDDPVVDRIYDSPARHYHCHRVTRAGAEYWEVPLADNADRIVRLTPVSPLQPGEGRPLICVFHDIEENVDTDIPASECQSHLTTMLRIEKSLGVRATYSILGNLLERKRDEIWSSDQGHSLAFHSFNHDLTDDSQLERCRRVDLQ